MFSRRQVREAATSKEPNADLVDLKLDLERTTSAHRQTLVAATSSAETSPVKRLAGLGAGLAEPPEEASTTKPQLNDADEREPGGFRREHGGLDRISEHARSSMVRFRAPIPLHPLRADTSIHTCLSLREAAQTHRKLAPERDCEVWTGLFGVAGGVIDRRRTPAIAGEQRVANLCPRDHQC